MQSIFLQEIINFFMKPLYQNQFVEILLDEPHGIIEMAWLPDAPNMSDDDFKEAFTTYAELTERHHPSYYLTYNKGPAYTILPHLQEWLAANIVPRAYQAGVAVVAIVVTEDIYAQLAAEQTVEEGMTKIITSRFFPNYEAARAWLMKLAQKKAAQKSHN